MYVFVPPPVDPVAVWEEKETTTGDPAASASGSGDTSGGIVIRAGIERRH